jgi:uncharacterized protein (TIGR03435 family)
MRLFALLLGAALIVSAQEFEVASIRPAKQDGNRDVDTYGSRFEAHNLTLKRLVGMAWDVDDSQVVGGPNWIDSESYDIKAAIPAGYAPPARDQFLRMLQNLLAERFRLAVHRELRQTSGYALIVTRSGSKMISGKPNGQDGDFHSTSSHLKAANVTMEAFARRLSRNRDIGRTVVDKTGLTGRFDFDLDWAPAQLTPAQSDPPDDRPGIFTALQEQLGLKLQSEKVSIQAVVVDRAEKPSEN